MNDDEPTSEDVGFSLLADIRALHFRAHSNYKSTRSEKLGAKSFFHSYSAVR